MLLALLLAQAVTSDVIVTGERLERIHKQCVGRRCTPLRDAQASIAWAETLFREGRYVDAKRTLAAAAARNKRYAATDPKPVASIYEAYATVPWHEGDQDDYRDATAARVRTLRANLPADDVYVRAAALALGDMWMRLGQPLEAQDAYKRAERDAREAGFTDVMIRARLARARTRRALGDRKSALALLAEARGLPGADEPINAAAIRATRLRLATAEGDDAEIAQVAAELRRGGYKLPVLVWAAPYPRTADELARLARARGVSLATDASGFLAPTTSSSTAEIDPIRWADIGFWIRPDGRTAEVEVLRGSREGGWARPYLTQVATRRYAVTPGATGGDPGEYRIERFTLRGNYGTPTGSLIRRRMAPGALEVLDLTDANAKVTAAR